MTRKRTNDDSGAEERATKRVKKDKLAEIRRKVREGFAKDDKARLEASRAQYGVNSSGVVESKASVSMPPRLKKTTKVSEKTASPAASKPSETKRKAASKAELAQAREKARQFFKSNEAASPQAKTTPMKKVTPPKAPTPVPFPPVQQQIPTQPFAAQAPNMGDISFGGISSNKYFTPTIAPGPVPPSASIPPVQQQIPIQPFAAQAPIMGDPGYGGMYQYTHQHALSLSPQQQHPIWVQMQSQDREYNSSVAEAMTMDSSMNQRKGSTVAAMKSTVRSPPVIARKSSSEKEMRLRKPRAAAQKRVSPPVKSDDSEDEDVPPPDLQTQYSQIVIENALSDPTRSPPHVVPPQQTFNQNLKDVEEKVVIDGSISKLSAKKQARWRFVKVASILICVAAVAFQLIGKDYENDTHSSAIRDVSDSFVPCFASTSGNDFDCREKNKIAVPCPEGGACAFGELAGCPSPFLLMTDKKDDCVLTEDGKGMLDVLTFELASQTRNHETCDPFNRPTFRYHDLRSLHDEILVPESEHLIELLENKGFLQQLNNNELIIGLPRDHPENKLPFTCHMANTSRRALNRFGSIIWTIGTWVYTCCLSFARAYPWHSMIGLIIILAVSKLRDFQLKRAKKNRDVAMIRTMALDILQKSPNVIHHATHIRDTLAHDLHPEDKGKRLYIQKVLWSYVVSDIRRDTRVRKSQVLVGGNNRDTWQWIAGPASIGKVPISTIGN